MKRVVYILLAVLSALTSVSCVEELDLKVDKESSTVLVVDGLLTTERTAHCVKLSTSVPYSAYGGALPSVSGARVTISDGESTVTLKEDGDTGRYYTPEDYCGVEGRTYTLDVKASLDGEEVSCSAVETMPVKGIRADDMDYYKMTDSLWVFAIWGQDLPGIISHYGGELVVHDNRLPYNDWVFIDGSDMFDGNYLEAGEYLFYSSTNTFYKPGDKRRYPLVEGDVVTLRFYSMADFFYEWFMSMSTETTAHFPMFSPQPANLPTNMVGDATGVFGLANLTELSVKITDPERTRMQMYLDHYGGLFPKTQ